MATSLFKEIIFGPMRSRRLGVSLGINLLPTDNKLCNFDCVYCECGWTKKGGKPRFIPAGSVREALEKKLSEMDEAGELPDVITFAGNGEPTMHPDFERIVDFAFDLRDRYAPQAKIAVLSNATMIGSESVRRALGKVDRNILKLDSAFDETARLINGCPSSYSVAQTVENMKLFHGDLIIQTLFLRGEHDGRRIDNTTRTEVDAWLKLIADIRPRQVMVYTIDRDTPAEDLYKVTKSELERIGERVRALGIDCQVAV
ncbi:MAG: radical SAM protein [Rikenellaceae bacterium]|jgi:wyosine [tRNA(Phe)-imidazoG37] synthetase (radical SAM superfamily)|nr:radical SAM protein [Rikenellaceae bacterium]